MREVKEMSKKVIIVSTLALLLGVGLGGVFLNGVSADESQNQGELRNRNFEQNLSEEEKLQIQERRQEMQALQENINREVVKTEEGIQINLTGENEETINKMHEMYDENGGEWGKWGMGGKMMRQGFIDEDGNGVCDHLE